MGGPGRLADFTGVAGCEGGTGHAPGGRTRNHCAPFLAIFHLYTPENPSTPRLSLYSYSLHPLPRRTARRGPGYARDRRRGREPCLHRACTAHPSISFYYHTESTAAINPRAPDALKSEKDTRVPEMQKLRCARSTVRHCAYAFPDERTLASRRAAASRHRLSAFDFSISPIRPELAARVIDRSRSS